MSFLRKKRIKFAVELIVDRLTDVSLLNATLFAKVRLLDCGSFEACTPSKEVRGHACILYTPADPPSLDSPDSARPDSANGLFDEDSENRPTTSRVPFPGDEAQPVDQSDKQPFRFQCRIPYDQQTGELDKCPCKISIRKVERAGRQPTKLGFVVVNLSEYAASGSAALQQSYLLDGYTGRQRQDNSRVHISVRMSHQTSDPFFKVPTNPCQKSLLENSYADLNPADRKAPSGKPQPSNQTRPEDTTTLLEVRRRLDDDSFGHFGDDRPASAHGAYSNGGAQLPQSSTHTSFSSSGSDGQPCALKEGNSPPLPQHRFSAQAPASERRTSVPVNALLDRQSWHGNVGEMRQNVTLQNGTLDFSLSTPTALELRRNCTTRRMSEDRMVAPQNVPNRVQQTRRDADSVIEEVLAEAAAGCIGEERRTRFRQGVEEREEEDYDAEEEEEADQVIHVQDLNVDHQQNQQVQERKKRNGLELFVSRTNGDVLLGAINGGTHGKPPAPNFERVSFDTTSLTS